MCDLLDHYHVCLCVLFCDNLCKKKYGTHRFLMIINTPFNAQMTICEHYEMVLVMMADDDNVNCLHILCSIYDGINDDNDNNNGDNDNNNDDNDYNNYDNNDM